MWERTDVAVPGLVDFPAQKQNGSSSCCVQLVGIRAAEWRQQQKAPEGLWESLGVVY